MIFFFFSILLLQNEKEDKPKNNLSFNKNTIEPVRSRKEDKPYTKVATSPMTLPTSPKLITPPTSPTSSTSRDKLSQMTKNVPVTYACVIDVDDFHKPGGINGREETQASKKKDSEETQVSKKKDSEEEPQPSQIEDAEEESRQSTTEPEKTNDDKQKSLFSIFKYYTETNQFNGYVEVETPKSDVCWVCTEILQQW